MKKRIISTILFFALVISNFGLAYGEAPVQPNIEGLSADEANVLINEYNTQVQEYNDGLDSDYELAIQQVNEHNAAEDEKVAENQQAISDYKIIEQRIANDALKGITDNRVTDGADLPTGWETTVTTGAAITFKVEDAEVKAGDTFKAINIHLYLDEEYDGDTYYGTDVRDEVFVIDQNMLDHVLVAEWETVELDLNDIATVISEARPMGYKSAAFYRKMEGYYNGYWTPAVQEFVSLCNDVTSGWDAGVAQTFSYDMGGRYNKIANVFSLYTYEFVRTGEEPVKPVPYSPEYLESPAKPVYVDFMELIQVAPEEPEEPDEPIVEPDEPTDPEEPEIPDDPEEPDDPPVVNPDEPNIPSNDEPENPDEPIVEEPEEPIIEEPTVPDGPAVPGDTPEEPAIEEPEEPVPAPSIPDPKPNPHKEKTEEPQVNPPVSEEPAISDIEESTLEEDIADDTTPLAGFEIEPEEPVIEEEEVVPAAVPVRQYVVMQTEEEETAEEPVLVSITEEEEVEEEETPLASPEVEEKSGPVWALVNLIAMVLTALALLKLDKRKYNIVNIILAVGAILLFVFTENTQNPMVLVDKWTIVQIVVYVAMIISRVVSPKEDENEEEVE